VIDPLEPIVPTATVISLAEREIVDRDTSEASCAATAPNASIARLPDPQATNDQAPVKSKPGRCESEKKKVGCSTWHAKSSITGQRLAMIATAFFTLRHRDAGPTPAVRNFVCGEQPSGLAKVRFPEPAGEKPSQRGVEGHVTLYLLRQLVMCPVQNRELNRSA